MLLVSANLAPSSIHGIGLFAGRAIRRGEVVTVWEEGVDAAVPPGGLRPRTRRFADRFGYVGADGLLRVSSGPERYINHSREPNLGGDPGKVRIALRDIAEGEELVEDYRVHEPGIKAWWA